MVPSEQHLYQTIVQFDKTVVLPRKLATGSIHDYMFCYCLLEGILFEVLRIVSVSRSPVQGQRSCILKDTIIHNLML